MAGMIASLLEHGRFDAFQHSHGKGKGMGMGYPQSYISHKGGSETVIHPPLKFVVVYSGFKAMQECYQAFYEPKIKTPVMHFLGRVDSVVEENRSLALVDACEVEQVVYHPGGHFVPSQRVYLERVVEFVRSCLEKE
ncbi:MAG: H(+)-transporting V1 sector ATPase subunit A [Watsoniomyces obsoletus]|nr:MAG: H(+)-transporting V1 sector ATPase subunit A [Watsoniomyces obsoletus]